MVAVLLQRWSWVCDWQRDCGGALQGLPVCWHQGVWRKCGGHASTVGVPGEASCTAAGGYEGFMAGVHEHLESQGFITCEVS